MRNPAASAFDTMELCQLLARLTDAVELIVRDAGHDAQVTRLHNIRHDALTLMNLLKADGPAPGTTGSRGKWFTRRHDSDLSETNTPSPLRLSETDVMGRA